MKPLDWSPKRWLRLTLPAVLIIIWLMAAAVGGPTFGKISDVSSNDQASFLPASAESTIAREWQLRFVDSNVIPAVVLLTGDEPLTQPSLGKSLPFPLNWGPSAECRNPSAGHHHHRRPHPLSRQAGCGIPGPHLRHR